MVNIPPQVEHERMDGAGEYLKCNIILQWSLTRLLLRLRQINFT